MKIKEFWLLSRGGEFVAVLEFLLNIKFFDSVGEGISEAKLTQKFSFVSSKFEAILLYLEANDLIARKKGEVKLSKFSKQYLLTNSEDYIGDYVLWKARDFDSWRANIGNVLTGKMATLHGEYQCYERMDQSMADLEGVTLGCARIYPSAESAKIIAKKCKTGTLVDIACGTGLWGFRVLRLNPKLNLICYDREVGTVERLRATDAPARSKVDIVKGDMFKDRLPKAEYALIANTLMDWDDEQVKELIVKAKKECEIQKLFIYEFVLDGKAISTGYNLLATIETRGRVRPKKWWKQLLGKEFKKVQFNKTDFGSCLIVCS